MRTFLRAVSVVLLVVGVPAGVLATAGLVYSWLAPVQAPPSMNELPAVIVGIAMHIGLNASRPPDDVAWTREHKRLW